MTESVHAARGHALWSASATEGNWECEGRLAMNEGAEDIVSVPADWGTVAHEIAEDCLFDKTKSPHDFVGETRKGKQHEIVVDEEMADVIDAYLDYCQGRVAAYKAETGKNALIFVEEYLPLAAINPPFEAGGTGDFVAIFPEWKMLEVVDLKTGRGVNVKAFENRQARSYALGAVLRHPGHDIQHVRSTIVQPRTGDGKPKSETYHIADLLDWTTDLLAAMRRAKAARDAYAKVKAGELSLAEFAATYLKPGEHCRKTFCKVEGSCPAVKQKVLDTVGVWFEETGEPRLANAPLPDDPVERGHILDMLDMIEGWVASVREREHRLAEGGSPAANYILVEKEGREKWNDGTEAVVLAAAKKAGLPEKKYLNPGKLKTPKQIRKELGQQADLVAGLSNTPKTGLNLVRATKTTRAPVQGTAERFFEPS